MDPSSRSPIGLSGRLAETHVCDDLVTCIHASHTASHMSHHVFKAPGVLAQRHARGCHARRASCLPELAALRGCLCPLLSDVIHAMGQRRPGTHPHSPRPTGSLGSLTEAGQGLDLAKVQFVCRLITAVPDAFQPRVVGGMQRVCLLPCESLVVDCEFARAAKRKRASGGRTGGAECLIWIQAHPPMGLCTSSSAAATDDAAGAAANLTRPLSPLFVASERLEDRLLPLARASRRWRFCAPFVCCLVLGLAPQVTT